MHLSLTCLTYLSFDPLDGIFEQGDTVGASPNIPAGDFVLLEYAAAEWLSHVSACSQSRHDQDLMRSLTAFYKKRGRTDVGAEISVSKLSKHKYRALRRDPLLVRRLSQCEVFVNRAKLDLVEEDGAFPLS